LVWSLSFVFLSSSSSLLFKKRFVGVVVAAVVVSGGGVIDFVMNNSDAVPWRVSWSCLLLLILGPSSRLPQTSGRCAADGPQEFGRDFDGSFSTERSADDDPQQQPTMTITIMERRNRYSCPRRAHQQRGGIILIGQGQEWLWKKKMSGIHSRTQTCARRPGQLCRPQFFLKHAAATTPKSNHITMEQCGASIDRNFECPQRN
jgi:hypothetical protein